MREADRIGDYLRQLTPHARSCLLIELERLEACGAEVPGTAALLENLRAEFSQKRQNAPSHRQSVATLLLSRRTFAGRWCARTRKFGSHPSQFAGSDLGMDQPGFAAEDGRRICRPDAAIDRRRQSNGDPKGRCRFSDQGRQYLDNVLGSPQGAASARSKLATYTASHAAYDDLTKLLSVLRARDALAKFSEALPSSIEKFDDIKVLKITRLLHAFRTNHPEDVAFALALVAKRLKIYWQLIRLATKASPSKSATDVAAIPYAIAVPMVLDRLEDRLPELRIALKNNRVLVAKEILTDIYDTEYALQIRIDHLDHCEWGKRLDRLMKSTAALVEAEVARFPDNVGHVLGSIRQHRRQSPVVRLIGYLTRRGRDVLSNGALRRLKLMGQLRT